MKDLRKLRRLLSPGERARAARFRFSKDRNLFVVQRGLLRILLGRYLSVSPTWHRFVCGPCGKPEVSQLREGEFLHFNVSHSGSIALYAFTRNAAVGVDIERVRAMDDLDNIAHSFFSAGEAAALHSLPDGTRMEAFFNGWTRKEAVLKATGRGIAGGVDGVEVTLVPGEPARVLNVRDEINSGLGWTLHALEPVAGYASALAYQGRKLNLKCWTVPASVLNGEAGVT